MHFIDVFRTMILSGTISKGRSFREGNHLRNHALQNQCCFILSLVFACGNYLIWKLSVFQEHKKSHCIKFGAFVVAKRSLNYPSDSLRKVWAEHRLYVFITQIHRDISRWTMDPSICPNENVVWYHKLVLMQLTDEIAPINWELSKYGANKLHRLAIPILS